MEVTSLVIPLILCFTAVFALFRGVDIYAALVKGAESGFTVLLHILPPLVVLFAAIGMFRASGAMEFFSVLLSPAMKLLGIPPETAPLLLIRPISGSGALAVGSELMQQYGADSLIGRTAAVMLGAGETTFYTTAVYFGSCGITKTRYTIPAALCADLVMFWVSAFTVRLFFA